MLRSFSEFRRKKHRKVRKKSGLKWYKVDREGILGTRRLWIPESEKRDGDHVVCCDDHRPTHTHLRERHAPVQLDMNVV